MRVLAFARRTANLVELRSYVLLNRTTHKDGSHVWAQGNCGKRGDIFKYGCQGATPVPLCPNQKPLPKKGWHKDVGRGTLLINFPMYFFPQVY